MDLVHWKMKIDLFPAVPHNFCSPLSVPLECSCWPSLRRCGAGGFKEQGQCFFIGLSCSIPIIVFYYFSISLFPVYRLVLWGWCLRTDRVYYHSLTALHCRPLLMIIKKFRFLISKWEPNFTISTRHRKYYDKSIAMVRCIHIYYFTNVRNIIINPDMVV